MGLVRELDHEFYCIRVGTVLDDEKAQNMATVVVEDEYRGWSLEMKGKFIPV